MEAYSKERDDLLGKGNDREISVRLSGNEVKADDQAGRDRQGDGQRRSGVGRFQSVGVRMGKLFR